MKKIHPQLRHAFACAAALCCMHGAHAADPVVFDNGPSNHSRKRQSNRLRRSQRIPVGRAAANKRFGAVESFGRGAPWTGNFSEHAFRVSAVPEPAQLLMLLAGGTLVLGLRWRQQLRGSVQ